MLSLLAAVLLTSASADQIRRYSTYLEDGMTRDQVVAKLGNPDEVRLGVCGEFTAAPWRCYSWIYWQDGHHGALTVLFHERTPTKDSDDKWGVVLWSVI